MKLDVPQPHLRPQEQGEQWVLLEIHLTVVQVPLIEDIKKFYLLEFYNIEKHRKLHSRIMFSSLFPLAKCIENVSRQDCPICLEVSSFFSSPG